MAQARKISPEIHKRIIQMLKAGNYLETAAATVSVQRNTVRNWIKRGANGDAGYVQFHADVISAMAEAEARDVLAIGKASAKGDWRAAAWRLERRNAKSWGEKINITVEQELDKFFDRLEALLPPEIYAQVLEAAASDEGGPPPIGDERPGVAVH